jgi:LuxR family maltose regulon positive regulatory protein
MDSFPLVTRPRIVVPRRRDELLTRQRLLNGLMERLDNRLVIISAPAGYGKTSLLVDFVHHLEWPACWYAIDELDRDPLRFIAHFISSIQVRFPQFGRTTLGLLASTPQDRVNLDMLVAAAVNDIYDNISEHFVVVLDDYHLIDDSRPVNQFLSRFLQTVTENCHLFVASRTLLTLPDLPLLVARAQVGGMSVEELSFKTDEIQALFLQNERQVLPTELAREMVRKTEGWIAGLLLTSQVDRGAAADRRGMMRVAGVGLYDYLAQQVMEKQPQDVQEFLLRTSLLEEFTAAFCAEVIGPALNLEMNWDALMDAALRNNLFILPVDEESVTLRYHHLFLDFLQSRMREQRPYETASIQSRLAQVYASHGDWERAYRVYQRLGRLSAQVGLLEQAGPDLMISGRFNTLSEWLTTLPQEMTLARPVLLSLQGGLAIMRGDLREARTLLDQAIQGMSKDDDPYQLALAFSRRSTCLRLLGQYADAKSDAERALELTEEIGDHPRAHAEAQRALGSALFSMGQTHRAFEQLNLAHEAYRSLGDMASAARTKLDIGMAQRSLGQLDEAEIAYTQALELWESTGNLAWQANLLNNLGVLQHERGDYLPAVHSLERSVECARLSSYPRMEAFALTGLADIYRDLEAFNESLEAYRQAASLAERAEERYLLFYLDLARSVLARRQKRFPTARELLQAAIQRAQTGLAEIDQAYCHLEQASLLLVQEDFQAVEEELSPAADFFAGQGRRLEAARSQMILMLAASGREDWEAAQNHRRLLAEIWDSPAAWPPLVSAAREFLPLLERIHSRPEVEPQTGRLVRQVGQFIRRLPGHRRQLRPQAGVVPLGPAHVTIQTLGRMEVRVNRSLITSADWRTLVARDLFFFLLNHPQGLTKEQIGLVFWPDASPDQLHQRFRNLIYRLRHAVGSDVVVLGPDELYRFNHALDYEYDVETFERELDQAEKIDKNESRLHHLLRATRLYQGAFLPEIDAEWALVERERLKRRCLEGMLGAANLALDLNRPEQALQSCQAALNIDPSLEEAYRLAMRGYDAEGNRAGVIRQYQACIQSMQDEFGAGPSPQTVHLFEQLTR